MTVSKLSQAVCYFGKNLRNIDILFHVDLLRLDSVRHFLKKKDVVLSEV
jgi:hypothetical protein